MTTDAVALANQVEAVYHYGSPEWWDYQLAHHWEANGGPAQTHHFMTRLIDHLASPELDYLRATPTTALDWGCALGEGVAVWGAAFPLSRVMGVDIAQSAITKARERFPAYEFGVAEATAIFGSFDVIVTSNCLEHFENPLAIVRQHLCACHQLYIALVPYREFPAMETHLASFTEATFPAYLDGFIRLYAQPIDVDPRVWAGRQLLVVYGSAQYVQTRSPIDPAWGSYLEASPATRAVLTDLALGNAQVETRVALLEHQLSTLVIAKLDSLGIHPMVGDKGGGAPGAHQDIGYLLVQAAQQEQELRTLREQHYKITQSRTWRIVDALWKLRTRLLPFGRRRQ